MSLIHILKKKCNDNRREETKIEKFLENIDDTKINTLLNSISTLESKTNINQSEINNVANSIANIFKESAKTSFGSYKISQHINSNNTELPTWFGNKCKKARKQFHRAKYQYKIRKNETNRENLKTECKSYKSTLYKFQNKFKNKNVSKFRALGKSNPRKFWKLLNGKTENDVKAPLSELYDHFKNVNYDENVSNESNDEDENNQINIEINSIITLEEIEKNVKNLKSNKASGIDNILNEHIKCSLPKMKNIYLKFFNIVLNTGIVPESWTYGIINPIFKNKGDPKCAENYRPITLLSCMGKLFTSIINTRLQKFVENNNIINDYQTGFRSGFATVDNMFILHKLIQILQNKEKKLFCAFIDLKKRSTLFGELDCGLNYSNTI